MSNIKYNKRGYHRARKKGFRSGLEEIIARQIEIAEHKIRYEQIKIQWVDFAIRSYTPDFVLDNGIILEVKGFWPTADRRKHIEVKKQHAELDVRIVFENSKRKIRKGSKTSYGDWCKKNGILFCDKVVPDEWLNEVLVAMPKQSIEIKGNPNDASDT